MAPTLFILDATKWLANTISPVFNDAADGHIILAVENYWLTQPCCKLSRRVIRKCLTASIAVDSNIKRHFAIELALRDVYSIRLKKRTRIISSLIGSTSALAGPS